MQNPINKAFIESLMAAMPTPEEADEMGIYNDVVRAGKVYSYKGEYLGTVQDVANQKWRKEQWQRVLDGEISEDEYDQMCEDRCDDDFED